MYGKNPRKRNMGKRLLGTICLLLVGSAIGYATFNRENPKINANLPKTEQQEGEDSINKNKEAVEPVDVSPTEQYISPYTGLQVTKEIYNNIPFMVIVENSKPARPQSGLSEADIVYETMAEGGIPRFIALFHSNSPKEIGPVRSARPYFLTIAKEYDLPFGHCGGSPAALESIEKEKLMSMNEFAYGGYYWRDNSRKAPHNLYTSADKLRRLIMNKKYTKPAIASLKFNKSYWDKDLSPAKKVSMKLSTYYSTSYEFKDNLYYKYMDNEASTDRPTGANITASNIVVQLTDIKTLSDGRLEIKLLGQGKGYVISAGKYIEISWLKADENSPTILKDSEGNIVSLSPGNTWWHIADSKLQINFQ
ncbi:MAG: DUF3048 domain-containing protein [Clostridiales bacterium]|uniref:DUF3048 domain-containing protein n=1 Tax=Clostridium sp. N3C TaxID=1776758 RepID=UPI00092DF872|nr:DUF3048 domain-containing protein [Clostridium sp. N3C]NLZ48308.1 DUF3048 domain-containing protein [Clostridiales bacterium]SCN22982.1 putative lipoprotein YerB precursor [Clostridium sp. N3C]